MKENETPHYIHLKNVPTYEAALKYLAKYGELIDFQNVETNKKHIVHGEIVKVFPAVPVENGLINKVFHLKQANNKIDPNEVFRIIFQVPSGVLDELTVGSFLSFFKPRTFMVPKMRSFHGGRKDLIVWYAKPFKKTKSPSKKNNSRPVNVRRYQRSHVSGPSTVKTISGQMRESFFEVGEGPLLENAGSRAVTQIDDGLMMPPPSIRHNSRVQHQCPAAHLQCHCLSTSCGSHVAYPSCAQRSCSVMRCDHNAFGFHRPPCWSHPPLVCRSSSCNVRRPLCQANCQCTPATCSDHDSLTSKRMKREGFHHNCGSSSKTNDIARDTPDAVDPNSAERHDWYIRRWVEHSKGGKNNRADDPGKLSQALATQGDSINWHIEDEDSFSSISQVIDKNLADNPGLSSTKMSATTRKFIKQRSVVNVRDECESDSSNGSFSEVSTLFFRPNRPLVEKVKTAPAGVEINGSSDSAEESETSVVSDASKAASIDSDMNLNSQALTDSQKTWSQPVNVVSVLLKDVKKRPGAVRVPSSSENSSLSVQPKKKKKLYHPFDSSLMRSTPKHSSPVPSSVTDADNVPDNVALITTEKSSVIAVSNEEPCNPSKDASEGNEEVQLTQESDTDIVPPSDTKRRRKDGCAQICLIQETNSESKNPENELSSSEVPAANNEMEIDENDQQEDTAISSSAQNDPHSANEEAEIALDDARSMGLTLLNANLASNVSPIDLNNAPIDGQNSVETFNELHQEACPQIQDSNMDLTLQCPETPQSNYCPEQHTDKLMEAGIRRHIDDEAADPKRLVHNDLPNHEPSCSQTSQLKLVMSECSASNSALADARKNQISGSTDSLHHTRERLSEEVRRASPASTVFYDAEYSSTNAEDDVQHANVIVQREESINQPSTSGGNLEDDVTRKWELADEIFQVEGIIIDIEPHISEGLETLVEGVCKLGCKSSFDYQTSIKSKRVKRFCRLCTNRWHHICPNCWKSGTKYALCFEFHFELHIAIGDRVLRLQVEGKEAVNFLDLTVREYLAKRDATQNIIRKLKQLESSNPTEKKRRLKGHICIRTENRFDEIVPLIVNTKLDDLKWIS